MSSPYFDHSWAILYFATHQFKRARCWSAPFPVGRYWRAGLVVFFNYGLDTGTVSNQLRFMSRCSGVTSSGTGNHLIAK